MNARLAWLGLAALTLVALVSSATPAAATLFLNHPGGFASPEGWTLNGSTTIDAGNLRLTSGGANQVGSVFSSSPVDVRRFMAQFTFRLGAGTTPRADGFAFVIQGSGPTALGQGGSGLGSQGIDRSLAIKFDPFNNAGEGPSSIGAYVNGAAPTVPALDVSPTLNFNSGNTFWVSMSYDGAILTMRVTDTVTRGAITATVSVNIPSRVRGDTAYVGFTGATGALTAIHDIRTFTFETAPFNTVLAAPLNGFRATDVNDSAQMSGLMFGADGQTVLAGLLNFQPGQAIIPIPLAQVRNGAVPGVSGSGLRIGPAGTVVGFQADSMSANRFGSWWLENGAVVTIPLRPDFQSSLVATNGTLAGGSYFNATREESFLIGRTTGSSLVPISVPGDPLIVQIRDISPNGDAVGIFSRDGGNTGVFLRPPDGPVRVIDVPVPFLGNTINFVLACDPNDNKNDILGGGSAMRPDRTLQPALYREDGTTEAVELPPGMTQGFFVAGTAAGLFFANATGISGLPVALIYDANTRVWSDVNGLVPPTVGVHRITSFSAVNDAGTIVIAQNQFQSVALRPAVLPRPIP